MAYGRRDFRGNAAPSTITAPIDDNDTTVVIANGTNWPTGSIGVFPVVIDRGLASEEKLLCSLRASTTLTVSARGHDGTTAQAHAINAVIEHCLDVEFLDQASRYINLQTTKGALVIHNGSSAVALGLGGADADDDYKILRLSNAAATGWLLDDIPLPVIDSNAPAVAGARRLWYDTALRQLRASNGASWVISAVLPVVANRTARNAAFSSPAVGDVCYRNDYDFVEFHNGTRWGPLGTPRFASSTTRDAYFAEDGLFDGADAYTIDAHTAWVYRSTEWLRTSIKHSVADSQPSSPQAGDLWGQPV